MKIEYFPSIGKELPVVLIYGDEPINVKTLKKFVHALAHGQMVRLAVHELAGFESVDGCELFFSVASRDRGVLLVNKPRTFECSLRPVWWYNIEGLLEPFCEQGPTRFNDLDLGFYSKISLIISTDCDW